MRRRLGSTTTGRPGATPAAAVAAAAAVALALGGCSSTATPGETSSETSSEAPGETSSEAPSETPSTSASLPEPTPPPEPASGPRLDVSDIRVNAPKGWKQTFDSVVVDTALGRVDGLSGGLLLSVVATGGDVLSLKQAERYFWTRGKKPPRFERQDTTVMGGATAGHYTARDKYYEIHAVTLWDDNHVIKVQLNFDHDVPDDQQQELLQSVVASYSSPRMR